MSWLIEPLSAAMDRLAEHAETVGLNNTDECTFRAFLMAALKQTLPECQFQKEWRRVDLLLQTPQANTLIELKYYVYRRTHHLDGTPGGWKGTPGPKNEGEFYQCIDQLRQDDCGPIDQKHVILVFQRGAPAQFRRHSYENSYGSLSPNQDIANVRIVPHQNSQQLTCMDLHLHDSK